MTKQANGELKIEKGIPIPPSREGRKGYTATLRKLKVGESVVIPSSRQAAVNYASVAIGIGNYATRAEEGGGFRVWRIK